MFNKMLSLKTTVLLVFVGSFLSSVSAAGTAKVHEVRELLTDSVDYQNWCSKCRGNGTSVDIDLYVKLCHKFDAEMMEILESLDVNLTSKQFFSIFMDKDFCLNATLPNVATPSQGNNSSYYPGTYITVLSDLPGWNDTQRNKRKIIQGREGFCPLYWIIPVVAILGILVVLLGVTFIRYRVKIIAANKQTTEGGKQGDAVTVFDSVDKF